MYMLGKITYFDTALSLFMFCIASDLVCTFEKYYIFTFSQSVFSDIEVLNILVHSILSLECCSFS